MISFKELLIVLSGRHWRILLNTLSGQPDVFSYGFAETSADLDRSLSLFSEAVPLMVEVAEIVRSH